MDWNNDGNIDLILGEYNGYINYYQRNSDGSLQAGVRLQSNGSNVDVGLHSAPDFTDWDNDGDLDMLVGAASLGKVRLYTNTGTASSYQFNGYTDFSPASQFFHYYPSIADMNGDGLFDVILGSAAKTFRYYRNTGTPTNPTFAGNVYLKNADGTNISVPGNASRPEIADWNNDGLMDIITGAESNNYITLYTAIPVSVEDNFSGLLNSTILSIVENPVRSSLSLLISSEEAAVYNFTIFSMSGRVVSSHTTGLLDPGCNTVVIPNSIPEGAYVVRCTAGEMVLTERFVVTR